MEDPRVRGTRCSPKPLLYPCQPLSSTVTPIPQSASILPFHPNRRMYKAMKQGSVTGTSTCIDVLLLLEHMNLIELRGDDELWARRAPTTTDSLLESAALDREESWKAGQAEYVEEDASATCNHGSYTRITGIHMREAFDKAVQDSIRSVVNSKQAITVEEVQSYSEYKRQYEKYDKNKVGLEIGAQSHKPEPWGLGPLNSATPGQFTFTEDEDSAMYQVQIANATQVFVPQNSIQFVSDSMSRMGCYPKKEIQNSRMCY